jgi:ferredoxin
MCDHCVQHGEGQVWYLEAASHSREMMEKLRVEERIRRRVRNFEDRTVRLLTLYDRLSPLWRIGPLQRLASAWAERRQKKSYFGQVLPREHATQVLEMAGSIVRLPCSCRRFVKGRKEARYCLGLGYDPHKVYDGMPDYDEDFEMLTPEEAISLTETFQKEEGLVHTVWTLPDNFVATLCNCSVQDCGAMFARHKVNLNVLYPGVHKASVSREFCTGCGLCLKACQFGAMKLDRSSGKAEVNPGLCQGCGICRRECVPGAITLEGLEVPGGERVPVHHP